MSLYRDRRADTKEQQMSEPRDATRVTAAANAAVRKALPFGDTQDFDDVNRGLIASLPDGGVIKNAGGRVVWDLSKYSFVLDQDARPAASGDRGSG